MTDKAYRVNIFSDFLRSEGYVPEIDDDGDIVFKYEGFTYLIILDATDEEFFRVVLPNFWSIENVVERAKVEQAAIAATADTKVAKVFPVRDNVWATVELFCSPIENAKDVFRRSMSALQTAVRTFADEMNK